MARVLGKLHKQMKLAPFKFFQLLISQLQILSANRASCVRGGAHSRIRVLIAELIAELIVHRSHYKLAP